MLHISDVHMVYTVCNYSFKFLTQNGITLTSSFYLGCLMQSFSLKIVVWPIDGLVHSHL